MGLHTRRGDGGAQSGLAEWEKSQPQVEVGLVQKALFEAFVSALLHLTLDMLGVSAVLDRCFTRDVLGKGEMAKLWLCPGEAIPFAAM